MSVTPSQTVGPYFSIGLIHDRWCELCSGEGNRITVTGSVIDGDGLPVIDAMLEIWQPDRRAFGRFAVNPGTGAFAFDVLYPASLDGEQAPHLCVGVFARGLLKRLYTRIYFAEPISIPGDPVLALVPAARRSTLLASQEGTSNRYRFDVRLSGPGETVFFEC